MTVASPKLTFEEFLAYDDGTDTLYELENGVLVAVPAEGELNRRIVMLLVATWLKLGVAYEQLSLKTELAVSSTRVSVPISSGVVSGFTLTAHQVLRGSLAG
ncbi:MAG: hypothetical protein HC929_21975 [Leptolyngbyaceae cyanobacterium SM2_5_2]|nr:hypothetical protein [Leptolyngbyaceae cyanobacterium SM2_5_2]